MKHILTSTAAAICLMSSAAFAAPSVMTDEQMDTLVAAGTAATVTTKSGNLVWDVTNLENGIGTNNGGKGRTQNAAGGLLNAAGKGGLVVTIIQ